MKSPLKLSITQYLMDERIGEKDMEVAPPFHKSVVI